MRCIIILIQYDIGGSEWILGLGIVFGLAFVFTILTKQDIKGFLIFITMFICFAVWSELLEVWTLVICLITVVGIVYMELQNRRGGS